MFANVAIVAVGKIRKKKFSEKKLIYGEKRKEKNREAAKLQKKRRDFFFLYTISDRAEKPFLN